MKFGVLTKSAFGPYGPEKNLNLKIQHGGGYSFQNQSPFTPLNFLKMFNENTEIINKPANINIKQPLILNVNGDWRRIKNSKNLKM